MSTQAVVAMIDLDNSVKYVDLVNDGDRAGVTLAMNYNTFNAAKALIAGGVISVLAESLQNTIYHGLNFGREVRITNASVEVLQKMADVIKGVSDIDPDGCPVYVFDAREYYDDYTAHKDFHYHKMYGHGFLVQNDKVYWKKLNVDGSLTSL